MCSVRTGLPSGGAWTKDTAPCRSHSGSSVPPFPPLRFASSGGSKKSLVTWGPGPRSGRSSARQGRPRSRPSDVPSPARGGRRSGFAPSAGPSPSAWVGCDPPWSDTALETVQELAQREAVPRRQTQEPIAGPRTLSLVGEDRGIEARRAAVVQQHRPRTDAPKGRGAHLAAGGRPLNDPVAEAPHVVEQKIRKRLEYLVRQRPHRAGAGDQGRRVAVGAADGGEDSPPREHLHGEIASGWRREQGHEVGELRHARAVVVQVRLRVVREQRAVALRTVLVRELGVCDPHLIQVGVAGKLMERGNLRLPPEAPYTVLDRKSTRLNSS